LEDQDGKTFEKISVQPIKCTSLTVEEIMSLVDTYAWGEYESEKVTPKETSIEKEGRSKTRVVPESEMSSPRNPTLTYPHARETSAV